MPKNDAISDDIRGTIGEPSASRLAVKNVWITRGVARINTGNIIYDRRTEKKACPITLWRWRYILTGTWLRVQGYT